MHLAHSVFLVSPVIASVSAESRETVVDMNGFHCVLSHANEFLLRETDISLDVELLGKMRPCTACSMATGYRKPIANTTK